MMRSQKKAHQPIRMLIMFDRSIRMLLTLSLLSVSLIPLQSAFAVTTVAAKLYDLQIQHAHRSSMKLSGGRHAIEFDLMLANGGGHGLYDIRVFLIRPDTRTPVEEPARVRVLPAGEQTALTWTFELPESLSATTLRDVTFRIEAVDQSTQEIVSFNQKSTEAR